MHNNDTIIALVLLALSTILKICSLCILYSAYAHGNKWHFFDQLSLIKQRVGKSSAAQFLKK